MKKILSLIVALTIGGAEIAKAAPTGSDISIACGLSTPCGAVIASINVYLANNVYLKARNAANNADLDILKADTSDNIELNAGTGKALEFTIAGTAEATLTDNQVAVSGATFEVVPGATSFTFKNNADNANNLGIADAGAITIRSTFTSSATSDLGWAVVAGANTACNTTCTSACVFGVNTAATEADIVGCADATADECLCAGAS